GGGWLVGESAVIGGDAAEGGGLDLIAGDEPSPELAAQVVDEYRRLRGSLRTEALRQVLDLRLEVCLKPLAPQPQDRYLLPSDLEPRDTGVLLMMRCFTRARCATALLILVSPLVHGRGVAAELGPQLKAFFDATDAPARQAAIAAIRAAA